MPRIPSPPPTQRDSQPGREGSGLCATHARRWAEKGSRALSLGCQGRHPRGEPLPSLSPPGQGGDEESQENKDHILPCEAEASAGETMASLGSKRAGPRLGTKAESQLDGSPPPLTKVSGEMRAGSWEAFHLTSRPPAQLQESSLAALPPAGRALFQAGPLLENMPLPSFPPKCAQASAFQLKLCLPLPSRAL